MEAHYVNFFAILLASMIVFDGRKIRKDSFPLKIFDILLYLAITMLVLDVLANIFDGKTGSVFYVLNLTFNVLLYVVGICSVFVWLAYADYQIFQDNHRIKHIAYTGMVFFVINAALSILNVFYNIYFTIDKNNVYHRGQYFWVFVSLCYGVLIFTSLQVFINRKSINSKQYYSMLLFPIPQIIGSALQVLVYGIHLKEPGFVLSLLLIYFYIQDDRMNTDYLTGVLNRRSFDFIFKNKIKDIQKSMKPFAVILLDMDNFKQINDRYGHMCGDEAIVEIIKLLRSCLHSNDLILRLGGDEFYIILNVDNKEELMQMVTAINLAKDTFNRSGQKPYTLNFSMGYELYTPDTTMSGEDFIRHIDHMMYAEKARKKKWLQSDQDIF